MATFFGVIWLRLVALLVVCFGLAFVFMGAQLAYVGGSLYYVSTGIVLIVASVLLWRKSLWGFRLFAVVLLATLIWSLYEAGLVFWPMVPRLSLLTLLALLLLFALPQVVRQAQLSSWYLEPLSVALLVVFVVTAVAFKMNYDVPIVSTAAPSHSLNSASTRTDWPSYGNSEAGTRYSPLDQLTAGNVSGLELAWTFRTGVTGVMKGTPTQIGDKLYVCNGGNVVIALDAESGEEEWRYDPEIDEQRLKVARYFTTTCRGVSYYQAPADYNGECPSRILTATVDARMIALNADTGAVCKSFGNNGEIDLTEKLGEVKMLFYFVTSAPAIVEGNAVVGGWVLDNREVKEPSGVIRAFDAITGQFAWAWDMGRPGNNQEPGEGEIYTRGTPNMWSLFSVDEERGMVFAPLGNETPDYFGADRNPASEKYASSVVALNGKDGSLIWSFQTVHHDIWDYDVPSQPVLVDVPDKDGALVPALIQATKRGEIFMLNRETGEPIAAVEERPVPQGGVPEDWTFATQPYSALPNLVGADLTEADTWGITPFDHMLCRIAFKEMRYEGHFTPPSTKATIQYPGNAGGYNWGSLAVDEVNHRLIVSPMNLANRLRLIPRAEMEAGTPGSSQFGTPYGAQTGTFMSSLGIPCTAPPYGMLGVIDLQTQQLLWKRAVGTANELGPMGIKVRLPLLVGTPLSAGTIVTKGGLIFQSGTMDRYVRAYDLDTGKQVWSYYLPQTSQSTPMSYLSPRSKKQMLIVTLPAQGRDYGGDRNNPAPEEDPEGGYVLAFKLAN